MNELTLEFTESDRPGYPGSGGTAVPQATPQYTQSATKNSERENLKEFETTQRRRHLPGLAGYSRYVVFMKFLLPLAALILIAAIFIWPQVHVADNSFSIGLSDVQLTGRENPSMVNARFVGSDKKSQPFSITADLAKNLLIGNSKIELEMPKADIAAKDGTWMVLTANTGIYNQSGKTLRLDGSVNLFHDSGYEFTTTSADIDLDGGIAKSTVPVRGQGPFGQLEAEGFRIENKGESIYFSGKVKLVLHPNAMERES